MTSGRNLESLLWSNRTRHRALTRLAARHADELAELIAEERQREPDPRLRADTPAQLAAKLTARSAQ